MTIIRAKSLKVYGIAGPTSAVDNEIPVFDGATGKKIKAGTGLIVTANLVQAADKAVLLSGVTGGTPASGAGTRMMWIPAKEAVRFGKVSGDDWDDANIGIGSIAGGNNNKVSSTYSAVLTGQNNDVTGGTNSAVLAGSGNKITNSNSGILAGLINSIAGQGSAILAGMQNSIDGMYSGIGGGAFNHAHGDFSFVCGKNMRLSSAAGKSFVFGYSLTGFTITQPNTFYIFPGGVGGSGKVAIGTATPATSAIVDIVSTIGAFLPPRMTEAQRDALTPVNGMILYNNTANQTQTYENGAWRQI